ncbi:lipoprotein [Haemophilus influenzae]|uniref:Lipoprotein n=1 Tax=Haemophilus influenzae TaxID=727 RepID=A0A2X1PPN2_HAEIF|nr:lipoprotein [Haemophilus influenzae]
MPMKLRKINYVHWDLNKLSPSQKSRYYETLAIVAENRKDMIEAVKARIEMDKNLTDVQRRQDNIDKTWALLRSANTGVINNASDEGNAALGGWLTLIKAYNDYIRQPVQLSQALQSWKMLIQIMQPQRCSQKNCLHCLISNKRMCHKLVYSCH